MDGTVRVTNSGSPRDALIVGSDFDRNTGLETISGYRLNRFAIPHASGS